MRYPGKISLARLPTPIQKLERLSTTLGKEIYVWRDDLTGFTEAGNKIRKLEFVLADALEKKATCLVTCGGPQSNHARATAVLARRLGLGITIVMREPPAPPATVKAPNGNLLLDLIYGAEIRRISYEQYRGGGSAYDVFLEEAAAELRRRGETPYIIGEGASVPRGCFGYIAATEELKTTWQRSGLPGDGPDSLFVALGSGGTLAGLALGFELHGLGSQRIQAINICDSRDFFEKRVGTLIAAATRQFDLGVKPPNLQILDGHLGKGYGIATDEEMAFYVDLARREGLLLDPVYTGKAFRGMLAELKKAGGSFGERILFLHSGGVLANFAYADDYLRVLKTIP